MRPTSSCSRRHTPVWRTLNQGCHTPCPARGPPSALPPCPCTLRPLRALYLRDACCVASEGLLLDLQTYARVGCWPLMHGSQLWQCAVTRTALCLEDGNCKNMYRENSILQAHFCGLCLTLARKTHFLIKRDPQQHDVEAEHAAAGTAPCQQPALRAQNQSPR